jgi:hypothetical protein
VRSLASLTGPATCSVLELIAEFDHNFVLIIKGGKSYKNTVLTTDKENLAEVLQS